MTFVKFQGAEMKFSVHSPTQFTLSLNSVSELIQNYRKLSSVPTKELVRKIRNKLDT